MWIKLHFSRFVWTISEITYKKPSQKQNLEKGIWTFLGERLSFEMSQTS